MKKDKKESAKWDEREFQLELGEQIRTHMNNEDENQADQSRNSASQETAATNMKKEKKKIWWKVLIGTLFVLTVLGVVLIKTKLGRSVIYTAASKYIINEVKQDEEAKNFAKEHNKEDIIGKKEDGIHNYLIFGIEEIGGAKNTDSMMIVSVNMGDGTIKLTSLMRDSYVTVPGWKSTKLNAAYAKGGATLLIQTIEENYKVHIEGYAHVNFEAFEKVVDSIGGVTIELGETEAKYLRRTNYISNPEYRDVVAGENHLNGNQLLGYCRVRKVATLGGVNNDYGRTLRQRRALSAIFNKVKKMNIFDIFSMANNSLAHITTSLSANQIRDIIEVIMENPSPEIETLRLPADGAFNDPKKYNGITYPLVYDWDKNIDILYDFIYTKKIENPEETQLKTE